MEKKIYEDFYGIPLEYTTESVKRDRIESRKINKFMILYNLV